MELIHVNTGGRHFKLSIGAKSFYFEDHPYLGPMVTDKDGEPLEKQLDADSLFFVHYEAWRQQGKRFDSVGGVNFCKYRTRMQRLRAAQAAKQGEQP